MWKIWNSSNTFCLQSVREPLLITTRNPLLGTLAPSIELSPMMPEEGMVFVLRRAKFLQRPTQSRTTFPRLHAGERGEGPRENDGRVTVSP